MQQRERLGLFERRGGAKVRLSESIELGRSKRLLTQLPCRALDALPDAVANLQPAKIDDDRRPAFEWHSRAARLIRIAEDAAFLQHREHELGIDVFIRRRPEHETGDVDLESLLRIDSQECGVV